MGLTIIAPVSPLRVLVITEQVWIRCFYALARRGFPGAEGSTAGRVGMLAGTGTRCDTVLTNVPISYVSMAP